ncbi:hypothetical protein POSPLADRAFT_1033279 [Postia placenta MAD-698-R-SB12]|uniref:F-box domain-containing protein n=1 Tax=Postia placenta MAD-698-R-SB12 TaxID=670580 RepID=A0A1X6N5L6_9APHY|nr:hypothetical protein POSPLADRAFT_1033279 [Postia placenta MAD-698-R-SB12]OSX63772.1 hypothetical protein POSPLADRAFT_1033279 [Postia placenta MAD-698-R-SB12]
MDAKHIPPELWMEIFEQLPLPSDLYNIMRTSKWFCDLAVRAIHRHVIWKTPHTVAHNLPLWKVHKGMEGFVHTLELGVTTLPPGISGPVVDIAGRSVWRQGHGEAHETYIDYEVDLLNYASNPLYTAMMNQVSMFTNIEDLTFSGVLLANEHYKIIHNLPRLRTLRIESCTVGRDASNHNHRRLPITDLLLYNLRRQMSDRDPQAELHAFENVKNLLTLALAPGLRTIRVDSSADIFKHVFSGPAAEARNHTIPPHLERLYILRRPGTQRSRFIAGDTAPHPEAASFQSFLARASTITTYSTFQALSMQQMPPSVLPALRCFSGPVESMHGVLPGRPIEAVQLLQCTQGQQPQQGLQTNRDGITALTTIKNTNPDLRMLSLQFTTWDDEIVHAATALFNNLYRLKITYEVGGPSEATISGLGAELLCKMPCLHTLQIYTAVPQVTSKGDHHYDPTYSSIEEELCDLLIPWNKFCPTLREVQLHPEYTMRRGFDGGPWNLLKHRRLNDMEEFAY